MQTITSCVFLCSFGPEGCAAGENLHQLSEVPALLEGARIRQVPQVCLLQHLAHKIEFNQSYQAHPMNHVRNDS